MEKRDDKPEMSAPAASNSEQGEASNINKLTKDDGSSDAATNNSHKRKQPDDDDTKQYAASSAPGDNKRNKDGDVEEGLSKSQLKKRRRAEFRAQKRREAKERKKRARHEKAKVEGRDLEEERRQQELNTKSGEGWKRRQEEWLARASSASSRFQICLDCGFEDLMHPKEINSLSEQIRYCYAQNKRSKNPVNFSVSSFSETCQTRQNLNKIIGFPEQWYSRAFQSSDKSLLQMHDENKDKLVYLTSDSENTLEDLDDTKIYVIGGIVDRNRLKRVAISKAEDLGIPTAKLPITKYLSLVTTKILTCNHVFEILLKYREHGNDWKEAMLDVLPSRKDVKPIQQGQKQKEEFVSEQESPTTTATNEEAAPTSNQQGDQDRAAEK